MKTIKSSLLAQIMTVGILGFSMTACGTSEPEGDNSAEPSESSSIEHQTEVNMEASGNESDESSNIVQDGENTHTLNTAEVEADESGTIKTDTEAIEDPNSM